MVRKQIENKRKYKNSKKGAKPKIPNKRQILTFESACNDIGLSILSVMQAFLGMRIGEALNLTWADVNLELEKVSIVNAKNTKRSAQGDYGKDRTICIPEFITPILRKWKYMNRGEEFVLPHGNSKANEKSWTRCWEKKYEAIYEKLGMREKWLPTKNGWRYEFNSHTWRHVCGTNLSLKGVPIQDIKEFLGHEDIQTTMKYLHLAGECLRNSINKAYEPKVSITVTPEVKVLVEALRTLIQAPQVGVENEYLQQQIV